MAFFDRFKKAQSGVAKKESNKDSGAVVKKKAAPEKKEVTKKEDKNKKVPATAYKVLHMPLVTEKAADIQADNKYVFAVAKNANKIQIAQAVEEVYGVKPQSINVMRMRGKNVRYGRVFGKTKEWKKAIITLKKGDSIQVYEGI